MALPLKADFLKSVEGLTYHERTKKAYEFGRDNASSPHLTEWINNMRQHPAPVSPSVPAEDGFTEILPPQQFNIAKFYVEDQVAVAATIGSKTQSSLLVTELSSPSKWFQKVAAKEVARQVKDDAVVEKQVLSGTRAVRKRLLHSLIREKRSALLEKLYPLLHQQKGPEVAIDILHGCSSAFIKAKFAEDSELILSPHLDWKKLNQKHGALLLELLEEKLKPKHFADRGEVWDEWSPRFSDPFFYKAHHTADFWKLWARYPLWKHRNGTLEDALEVKTPEPVGFYILYPRHISERLRHFLIVCKDEVFAFWKDTAGAENNWCHDNRFFYNIPTAFWSSSYVSHYVNEIIDLYTHFHKLAGDDTFWKRNLFQEYYYALSARASGFQTVQLFKAALQFYGKSGDVSKINDFTTYSFSRLNNLLLSNMSKLKNAIILHDDTKAIADLQAHRRKLFAAHTELIKLVLKQNGPSFTTDSVDEFQRVWNTISNSDYSFPVASIAATLEGLKPFTDKASDAKERRSDDWVYKWDQLFVRIGVFFINACGSYFRASKTPSGFYSEEEVQLAKEQQKAVINVFYTYWATDPVKHFQPIVDTYLEISKEQRDALYDCWTSNTIIHLLESVQSRLWPKLSHTRYQEHLADALASDLVTDKVKEDLQAFRDPSDHAARKELEKATDSNSEPQRKAAITRLVAATLRTGSAVQLRRTLSFLRTKLKNEQVTMRAHGIAAIMSTNMTAITGSNDVDSRVGLNFPPETGKEILDLYLDLLQDALEVRDLDLTLKDDEGEGGGKPLEAYQKQTKNHPVLSHFLNLSHSALIAGASDPNGEIFNFGIEVQWRMELFRKGPKEVVKSFSVDLPSTITTYHTANYITHYFSRQHKEAFIKGIVDGVNARVGEKNKDWRESYPWESLFHFANFDWKNCPTIIEVMSSFLAQVPTKKDGEGIYILDGTSPILKMFEFVLNLEKSKVYGNKLVQEYFATLLRSHQARVVVFQWLKSREHKLKRKAQKQQRDQSVQELLEISPSAIHLKFVWRHLVNWRQNKLDPFINAENPFRGPFYEPPTERKFRTPVEPKPTKTKKRRGGSEPALKLFSFSSVIKNSRSDIKNFIKEQAKAEKKMRKDLEKHPKNDHEDYYYLPACFALDRLLPRQVEALAQQWISISENADRSIPLRTVACRRWTIMPTVNYADIVEFSQKNSKFPINLLEALLQGTILNDEPLAPLNYLLTPEFLSSDRARIAAYAVSACVKYLKSVGITEIISLVLSGKRREGLKVTAYKEMIRLLASVPTSKHISMVETEWKRKELHRDVRITIVKAAFLFLSKNTEKGVRVAWDILLDAISKEKQEEWKFSAELITALLGATPEIPHSPSKLTEFMFLKPLILEFHNSTTKCKIPASHCAKFAEEVVVPLCTTALDNDVKTIALFSLILYKTKGEIAVKAAELLCSLMEDEKDNLLNSKKPNDQAVFDARWKQAATDLLKVTGCIQWTPSGSEDKQASKDYVTRILNHTVDRINNYKLDQRRKRIHMVGNLEHLLNTLPHDGPHSRWDWDQEQEFLAPVQKMGNFYWYYLINRRVEQFCDKWYSPAENAKEQCMELLHEMFDFASTRPDIGTKVVELVKKMLCTSVPSYNDSAVHIWKRCVLELMNMDVYPGKGSPSPAYQALVMASALQALRFGSSICSDHLDDVLSFFDNCIAAASKGLIPDLTKSLPLAFYNIAREQAERMNTKYWHDPRFYNSTSRTLVNHVFKYLATPVDGNITPLVIAIEYTNSILNKDPLVLALGLSRVGRALHWILQEQTGVSQSTTVATQVIALLRALDKNSPPNHNDWSYSIGSKPIRPVLGIISHLLDQELDCLPDLPEKPAYDPDTAEQDYVPQNRTKSTAYKRLSIEVSFAVLKEFPRFIIWRPKCFQRFVERVIEEDEKEIVSSPLRLQSISDLICSAYYKELCCRKGDETAVYAAGLKEAERLLDQAKTGTHPIFYRSLACHLSLFLGYLSTVRDKTDLTYSWRPEFIEKLDLFCSDEEGSIRKLAWEVDTLSPVTATPYSRLAM